MKTSKLPILLFSLLLSQCALAQVKREILEEDPKKSPSLRFEISPLWLMANDPNNYAGADLRIAYRHNNKFSVVGDFKKEYFDDNDGELNGLQDNGIYGYTKPHAGTMIELTGTYYFAVKEVETQQRLPIKSRQVGYRTIEVTVNDVDITKLNMFGFRFGGGTSKLTNTVSADISEVGNPGNKLTDQLVVPLQTKNHFFGGLSFTKIKNIKVRYPTYGIRRKQIFREFYADVLYGTEPKNSTLVQYESGVPRTYRIDKLLDNAIGYRVGIFSTPTGRRVNFGYGLEVAKLPYINSIFLNFRMAFSIFAKTGAKEE